MKKGRTFITNGPALFLKVGDEAPGGTLEFTGEKKVNVKVRWSSHYPLNKIGLIKDGELAEGKKFEAGTHEGEWETNLTVTSDGWIAARASGEARDSFNQAIYAHTSPVYVRNGRINSSQSECANYFLESIDQSMDWLDNVGRFTKDEQRDNVKDLFLKGRVEFEKLV